MAKHWNYRVIKHTFEGDDYYRVHSVYYENADTPIGVSKDSVHPHGDSVDELRADIELMLLAFSLPVLDYKKDFPE
jgi:hypothetical protein